MSQDSESKPSQDTAGIQDLLHSDSRNDFVSAVRLAASRILTSLHAEEERLDEILTEIEKNSFYQDFKNSWETISPEERSRKWQQQLELIVQTVYASRPYCLRCGDCCSRVSPSLHPEDLDLLKDGTLRFPTWVTSTGSSPAASTTKA